MSDYYLFSKKSKLLYLIFFLILLAVILGSGCNLIKTENNKHLVYANNAKDVANYFYNKTPGLKRAEKDGNVYEYNKVIEIPGGKGNLTIEKIWYSVDKIFIFYYVEGDVPNQSLASFLWNNGDRTRNYAHNMNIGEGIIYQGKYYSRLTFPSWNKYSKEKFSEQIRLKLTLNYGDLHTGEKVKLPEIKLAVNFDPEKEKVVKYDLDGKVFTENFGKLLFQQLIIEPQKTYLLFDFVNEEDDRILYLAGTLTTDQGEKRKLWMPVEPTGKKSPFYKLEFEALDNFPDMLSLNIEGMMLTTKEEVNFEIPVERFHNELKEPMSKGKLNKKVGMVRDVEIFLTGLFWDDRGLAFELTQDVASTNNAIERISTTAMYDKWMIRSFNKSYNNWRFPNVVTVKNAKGEEAGRDHYGQRGSGPGESISMFIDKEFIKAAKTIHVNVANLKYKALGPWSEEIQVK